MRRKFILDQDNARIGSAAVLPPRDITRVRIALIVVGLKWALYIVGWQMKHECIAKNLPFLLIIEFSYNLPLP